MAPIALVWSARRFFPSLSSHSCPCAFLFLSLSAAAAKAARAASLAEATNSCCPLQLVGLLLPGAVEVFCLEYFVQVQIQVVLAKQRADGQEKFVALSNSAHTFSAASEGMSGQFFFDRVFSASSHEGPLLRFLRSALQLLLESFDLPG